MGGVLRAKWRLSLLGGCALTGPDGAVDLGGRKALALLSFLVCTAPQAHSREKLATLLWGSHFEAQARQNLRQAVFRLRRVLGPDAIATSGELISLATPIACDAVEFEDLVGEGNRAALGRAIEIYQGELLANLAIAQEAWSDWVSTERRRLEVLALSAMVAFAEQEIASARPQSALAAADRALMINNLREDAHRLRMRALVEAGRKAEALRYYEHLVALLRRELGVEPDAATVKLVAEIKTSGLVSQAAPPPEIPKLGGPASPVPTNPAVSAEEYAAHGASAANAATDVAEEPQRSPCASAGRTAPGIPLTVASERRQLTVMSCELVTAPLGAGLVGSTALSARLDPEDLREVVSAYHRCAAETVRRFGGYVSQYLGDGVLAYFGYPDAHEDDAERAVRAGLELTTAVAALKALVSLQTRVGIATGLVVVGDIVDAGGSQQCGIVGETPKLAARLQGIAEPNSVVIAESTRRLIGNLFELQDRGARDLTGITGLVGAWAALRSASVASRFEALHASNLTDLIGRQEELELLVRRWSRAKNGEGQVVLLSGEAGIGKSRLTASLMERLGSEPHTRLRYFCSPRHTDSALYPIINQIERAAGFAHDDTTPVKLDKLDAMLAQSLTPPQDAALLADMLSLPDDARYPKLDLSPQQRRQRTFEALTTQLESLSHQGSVLMIFEDVHWADPTSLEAFSRAVDRIRALGVMLIVTYRPEFEPPWIGRPYVTALTLNRLAERDVDAMIDQVAGTKLLPADVRQDIIERSDGIPLFVEEMTKAVLEAEGEAAAVRAIAMAPSPAVAVPATLHASLMARLDRLGPAKEIAQIGAAIGRQFTHALLAAVVCKPEAVLNAALDRLIHSGLMFRQGLPPLATYLFKHALVQNAAYSTLLRARAAPCTLASPTFLKKNFQRLSKANPICWRITTLRPNRSTKPRHCGAKRDSGRWSDRP
jgi:class 3 adenylate cyclase/DNA-binding SARP family transcriptional activator